MEMMQIGFHDRASTEREPAGQVAFVDGIYNEIGKISRFNQRYFIDNRLEVEQIEGRLD